MSKVKYVIYEYKVSLWCSTKKVSMRRYRNKDQLLTSLCWYGYDEFISRFVNSTHMMTDCKEPYYMIFKVEDDEEVVVNPNTLLKQFLKYYDKYEKSKAKRIAHHNKKKSYMRKSAPRYRIDPIKWTSGYGHNGKGHSSIGLIHMMNANDNPDLVEYSVPHKSSKTMIHRKNYPSHNDYNWKSQYKVTRQYMIHLNKHSDTTNDSVEELLENFYN